MPKSLKKNTRKLRLVISRVALLLQQSKVHERTYKWICSHRRTSRADERCAPAVMETVVLHVWLAWSLSVFFSIRACISCQIDAAFQLHQARGEGFEVAM